jgi:phosphomannomutase
LKKSISGIRGVFGDDLTLKDIIYFCANFAPMIKTKKCAVGRDTRPSSEIVQETAIATLMAHGVDVYNLGMVPTPVVFRESRKYGSGLIITSSHNPLQWNGLKFIINGRGPNEREFADIMKEKKPGKTRIGREYKTTSDYIEQARKIIGSVKRSPKVIVDIGGGAAFSIAPELLKKIGCSVRIINQKASSRGPDPTSDKLSKLASASKNVDIGFAFDLDGDRLVVVKDGKKQSPDTTLALGVAKALSIGYKRFCLSIDTSIAVEKYIKDNGGVVVRSKVGEANVIDTMLKKNCSAGGEGSSGGFILPEFNMCRDGILTSGLIAAMMDKKIVDEIITFVSGYSQLRTKIDVPSKIHDKVLARFQKKAARQFSDIDTIDGVKISVDEDTWGLVRKSNTEDIIRISVESNNVRKAKNIQKELVLMLKESYGQAR